MAAALGPRPPTAESCDKEKTYNTSFVSIVKCDVDISKDLYANVVLHHHVQVTSERMTEEFIACSPSLMKLRWWLHQREGIR